MREGARNLSIAWWLYMYMYTFTHIYIYMYTKYNIHKLFTKSREIWTFCNFCFTLLSSEQEVWWWLSAWSLTWILTQFCTNINKSVARNQIILFSKSIKTFHFFAKSWKHGWKKIICKIMKPVQRDCQHCEDWHWNLFALD